MGFEPVTSQGLYAIAEIASITERIIALLDFISTVKYMITFIYHFIHLHESIIESWMNIESFIVTKNWG